MTCDHDATRASFAAFFGATRLIGGQDLPGEGWVLMGNCVACNSTLSIPIATPRGHALHGAIAADATARAVPGQDVIADAPPPVRFAGTVARHLEDLDETSDEHARRLIR